MAGCRVYLVTGRLAEGLVRSIASRLEGLGYSVEVVVLPVDVAVLADPRLVEETISRLPEGSVAILPPGLRVDHERLWVEERVRVVYGPRDPEQLPVVLRGLDPCSVEPGSVLEAGGVLRCECSGGRVFEARCGLRIGSRPPPAIIIYEYFAARGALKGAPPAHAVLVGFPRGVEANEARRVLGSSRLPRCWGVDTDNDRVVLDAVDMGASLVFSVDPGRRELLASLPRGTVVTLIPSGLSEPLPPPRERVERLAGLAEEALEHGLVPLLDPLLSPPCLGLLDSLEAYRLASRLGLPMLAGLGNVYELLDADTPGVLALLAALLWEAGVSAYLVTGESWKARLAPLEAPVALSMACGSCPRRMPPKDLGVSLLEARGKRPPRRPEPLPEPLRAEELPRVPFEEDPVGDNLVYAPGDGRIIVVHRWRDGRIEAIESRDPELLLRAALARGYASRLDHAAWLGLEVGRADAYTRLGRGYSSLEGQPQPPWSRVEELLAMLQCGSANPATRQRGRGGPAPPTP